MTTRLTAFAAVAALALPLFAVAQELRTPHGHPDISGVWDFRTVTPLERPEEFADQEFLSAEEVAQYEAERVRANNADLDREEKKQITTARGEVNGTTETRDLALAYNDFWWDRGTEVVDTRRTSLVIDPPNGRIPELTAEGAARRAERTRINQRPTEGPEDRPLGERCITGFNSGPPMLPAAYNMNVQIFQTPDHVVLLHEMVHNARVIPLGGGDHAGVPLWTGESRGRFGRGAEDGRGRWPLRVGRLWGGPPGVGRRGCGATAPARARARAWCRCCRRELSRREETPQRRWGPRPSKWR